MTGRRPRLHNLRTNEGETSPRRLIVLDTESRSEPTERGELHTLRLWCMRQVVREPGGLTPATWQDHAGTGAGELAETVNGLARSGVTTWLFAHNLSFDLTVTRLPLTLGELGWEIGQNNLASESPWARMKRGTRRLRLADSFSWLPVSVATLGELLEVPKLALPDEDDTDAAWLARCRRDVEITTLALLRVMSEWDRRRLGHFSLTGAGSGWNSLLHMTPRRGAPRRAEAPQEAARPHSAMSVAPVVIDPDPGARAFEREALYSGRRDIWRWGELPPEQYAELDFQAAHLTICANFPLPDRRSQAFSGLAMDDWRWENATRTMIARCRVRVERPRYPLRRGGVVLHPVGEFETVLCGPELREARRRGELLEVGPGWSYRVGHFMRPWSLWALGILEAGAREVDPVFRVMVKGWSRSVPGRWGMLVGRELGRRQVPNLGWHVEPAAFGSPPRHGHLVTLAGEQVETVRDVEADDSFPAVLAHIQSWARLLQARMIDALGEDHVVQVNTDSALVAVERLEQLGRARLGRRGRQADGESLMIAGARSVSDMTFPLVARVKAAARGGLVLSPQHLEHGGRRKFAGVPAGAVEIEPRVFRFLTWPKLGGQMERGDPRGYIRELKRVSLRELTTTRWRYEDGCCEPARVAQGAPGAGGACVQPPPGVCRHGAALSECQHRALR